jgi:hypothetical protein
MSTRWLAESYDDGTLSARVGRDADRLVAEWPGRARLSVARDGSDVVFAPAPEADPVEIAKLRRGAVRLLLGHLAGAIPLHGSAVAVDGQAIVFIGGTGLGKSTLAASLCDLAGASLLSDDAVVIERHGDGHHVLAVEEMHWLDAASARALGRPDDFEADKAPLATRRSDVTSAPLAMVVHLAFTEGNRTSLVAVDGLAAVGGLLAQLTRFVVDEPATARRDLVSLAEMVERTRIGRLERPRSLALLRETVDVVTTALHGEKP